MSDTLRFFYILLLIVFLFCFAFSFFSVVAFADSAPRLVYSRVLPLELFSPVLAAVDSGHQFYIFDIPENTLSLQYFPASNLGAGDSRMNLLLDDTIFFTINFPILGEIEYDVDLSFSNRLVYDNGFSSHSLGCHLSVTVPLNNFSFNNNFFPSFISFRVYYDDDFAYISQSINFVSNTSSTTPVGVVNIILSIPWDSSDVNSDYYLYGLIYNRFGLIYIEDEYSTFIDITPDSIVSSVYDSGFSDGFRQASEQSYNEGYDAGLLDGYSDGYNSGYDTGFNSGFNTVSPEMPAYQQGVDSANSTVNRNSASWTAGFNAGFESVSNYDYTFVGLISAVFDVPIKAFISLFNFDILGINLSVFMGSLLAISAVVAIIRFIL